MPSATEYPDDPPDDLAGWCRYFGLPEDAHINVLMRHVMANAAMTIAAERSIRDGHSDQDRPTEPQPIGPHKSDISP